MEYPTSSNEVLKKLTSQQIENLRKSKLIRVELRQRIRDLTAHAAPQTRAEYNKLETELGELTTKLNLENKAFWEILDAAGVSADETLPAQLGF